jgi:hypothetical protein
VEIHYSPTLGRTIRSVCTRILHQSNQIHYLFATLIHIVVWTNILDGEWSLTIVDKKPGDVSSCVDTDADWGIPTGIPYPATISCQQLALYYAVCENGVIDLLLADLWGILPYVDVPYGATNDTMAEACCACGGGIPADDLSETLFEWQLVVYGRDANVTTLEPSESPDDTTLEPTDTPSVIDSPEDCQSIGKAQSLSS